MIKHLKEHPDVIMLDCTYKTNKYHLPLLDICDVTGDYQTVPLEVCFMENERTECAIGWSLKSLHDLLTENEIPMPRVIVHD